MRSSFSIAVLSVVLSTLLSSGCDGFSGGDSSSISMAPAGSTLSGTASAGAPIIGSVTIKDSAAPSANQKTVTIAADGKYTIDVSGLAAPFMLRADGTVGGRSYSLYSAAVAADLNGTINVTPLTDLIVANVAGQIAGAYFAAGNFSTLTSADLSAQESALRARLQPILAAAGVSASTDLLRSSFAADHTGLDAALDVLRVDITGATATITNIISNQQITDNIASKTDTVVVLGATDVAAGLTELQKIAAVFDAFSAWFATALPASNNAALLALFDTAFLFDGRNRAAFLSDLTSNPTLIGVKFTNITLVPNSMTPAAAPTAARVFFSVIQSGNPHVTMGFTMNKAGTAWKMAGNGRIAQADAQSFARLQDGLVNGFLQPDTIDTGLQFIISEPTATGLAAINANVPTAARYYAVVSGAGLPLAGALYVRAQNGGSFYAAAGAPSTYAGANTPPLQSRGQNQYPLSDTAIAALLDNAIYTIKIYHDNATAVANATGDDVLLATYASNGGKRPYLASELAVASFAAITAPGKAALTDFANAGGTIIVTWTVPALGGLPSRLHFFRNGSTGADTFNIDLLPAARNTVLSVPSAAAAGIGTVSSNGIDFSLSDTFGRELVTVYDGS